MALTYRQIKGSPLTIEEADENIQTLSDMINNIDLSNFVTINTAQTITGQKTFSATILTNGIDTPTVAGLNIGTTNANNIAVGNIGSGISVNSLSTSIDAISQIGLVVGANSFTVDTTSIVADVSGSTLFINSSTAALIKGGSNVTVGSSVVITGSTNIELFTTTGDLTAIIAGLVDINATNYISLLSDTGIYIYYQSNGITIDASGFGLDSGSLDITFFAQNFIKVLNTGDATSHLDGSFRVAGGVGIEKKLFVGGVINAVGGIDVPSTGGTDTLNIGTVGAEVINFGNPSSTINVGAAIFSIAQLRATAISLQNTDLTYKVALDVSAANILRFGLDWGTLSIVPTTINVGGLGTTNIVSVGAGGLIIRNATAAQAVQLQTLGDANNNIGVVIGLSSNATNAGTTNRAIATITGTYRPTSGTGANFRGINIINTIEEIAPAANTITLIDINPTLTAVRGTIYGLRSRINAGLTGGGIGWNLFMDGTANNAIVGNIKIGAVTTPTGSLDILQSNAGNNIQVFSSTTAGTSPVVTILQNRVTTTDATPTTIHTFTTATGLIYNFRCQVGITRTGGSAGSASDRGSFEIIGMFKNVGGIVTLIFKSSPMGGADQTWLIDFVISGTNVLLQGTGTLNNNLTWTLTKGEIHSSGT